MPSHRERVMRGDVISEHLVQLFDDVESLVPTVTAFLADGWKRGDTILVVARPQNWAMVATELSSLGCDVEVATATGRLTVLDAATTLASFMVNGEPNPQKFAQSVGSLVQRLAKRTPSNLTIYGEMVDVLVAHGNFDGAEHLEVLWNELGELFSFRLLCGYSSGSFGDERTTAALHRICGTHDKATARPTDLLAMWLLANRRSRYHIDPQ